LVDLNFILFFFEKVLTFSKVLGIKNHEREINHKTRRRIMSRTSKANNPVMMVGGSSTFNLLGMIKAIYSKAVPGPAVNKGVAKPSYSGSTGSFKQNQRRERKLSHCRRVKRV